MLLKDTKTMDAINLLGLTLEHDIDLLPLEWSPHHNAQTLYQTFKSTVTSLAHMNTKSAIPKLDRKITDLCAQLQLTLNCPEDDNEEKLLAANILEAKISKLSALRHSRICYEADTVFFSLFPFLFPFLLHLHSRGPFATT